MITITAQIYDVVPKEIKNRDTGEITQAGSISALHKENGKPVLTDLTIDLSVFDLWHKSIGKEFFAEVRPWNINNNGSNLKGYALVDKKCLPTILNNAK